MNDLAGELEDLLEELTGVSKSINKLSTASVSGTALRRRVKDIHKAWLPLCGSIEQEKLVSSSTVAQATADWNRLVALADSVRPKAQYKAVLKTLMPTIEKSLLFELIKASGIKSSGAPIRSLLAPATDPELVRYLDESVRCAEANCVKAAVVLAWCAVAVRVQAKLASLGMAALEAEFDRMKNDTGLMFRSFTRTYKFTSPLDVQEVADAHLILLCRFLTWLDDTQYKHLKAALDLRNGCGHPTGYQPDGIKLQAFYSDVLQLVLLNPKFS